MWKSSGSTRSSFWMVELLTPSLRLSPATLRRKLISELEQRCFTTTDWSSALITANRAPISSVHLSLQLAITCEQDPEILKLLRLWQGLIPDPEVALHLISVKNHGLAFGRANFLPGHVTLRHAPVHAACQMFEKQTSLNYCP